MADRLSLIATLEHVMVHPRDSRTVHKHHVRVTILAVII